MKSKKPGLINAYFKMMENVFKGELIDTNESCFVYFASYYINKFIQKDLNIKGYVGFKNKDLTKDVFIITIPIEELKNKANKKYFNQYFEESIKCNERYVGIIKTKDKMGFLFKHDEELLNAYKTGQFSKISELKKGKMRKFKMLYSIFDLSNFEIKISNGKIRTPYIYLETKNVTDSKNYTLGKKDMIRYELYKMIYPEIFYHILAEQFNVKTEYLKKNNVQILPKPDIEKIYLELSENDNIYWFDKK